MIQRGVGLLMRRELARLDRAPARRRWVRAASVVGLSLVLLIARRFDPEAPFWALAWSQWILICFLQPVRAAGVFVEGRLDGTLPLLALTPLRPWAVTFGSILAALALAGEGLLIALPLFAISAVHADLAASDLALTAASLLSLAVLTTCVGAAVGARGGARHTVSTGFLRSLTWVFLLVLAGGFFQSIAERIRVQGPNLVPLARVLFLPNGLSPALPEARYVPLASLALSAVAFALATARTRRAIQDEEAAPTQPAPLLRLVRPGVPNPPARPQREPIPEQDPVAWRESRRLGAQGCFRPGCLAVGALVFIFGSGILSALQGGQREVAAMMAVYLASLGWLLLWAWGLMGGARSYVEDREDGTLELLLTTPLYDPRRLVGEKLRGALERGRWGIAAGCAFHCVAALGACTLREHSALGQVLVVLSVLVLWLEGARTAQALGQNFSLRAPTAAQAQTWAAALAGVTFFVGGFMACMFNTLWVAQQIDAGAGWVYGVHFVLALVLLAIERGLLASLQRRVRLLGA